MKSVANFVYLFKWSDCYAGWLFQILSFINSFMKPLKIYLIVYVAHLIIFGNKSQHECSGYQIQNLFLITISQDFVVVCIAIIKITMCLFKNSLYNFGADFTT